MNTKNLKAYAPKARIQFIDAVKKRAAHFGIYEDKIEEVRIEGGAAIIEGRAFTRKEGEQRKRLESKVTERGYDMFIREMAYTWFNRLAALRYMEIHDYFDHGFRVLSHPSNPESLPEILSHASDVADSLDLDKSHVIELQLAGDKEEELYRELLLGQCHYLYKIMPFMFEAIDDATELLLPNNLTKTDSILKGLTNDIPEEDWQEIEVIGWLYQFYISEHKDAVIGKVVKSEDIPAATQLFTPNWIVKYLVQNSVGRQWLATYPDSELKGKMDYYIEPAEQSKEVIEQLKAITPTSIDPEEIKVLDPACGSGHILVEVYEVLREIYLERGYRLREIPELILSKNIYGLDIDDRAAQLAGFALMMKAREDDRRIFQRVAGGQVSLNLFSLQSTEHLDILELWKALDLAGDRQTGATGGLFEDTEVFVHPTGTYKEHFELLQKLKSVFVRAKTYGSLVQIDQHHLPTLLLLKSELDIKIKSPDPATKQAAAALMPFIEQAVLLAQQYDAVIANPPYMGGKGMDSHLKQFVAKHYGDTKQDLYSCFMERAIRFSKEFGCSSFVVMHGWMFLSTFERTRAMMLENGFFNNMAHFGPAAFPGLSEYVVQTTAYSYIKASIPNAKNNFLRLTQGKSADKRECLIKKSFNNYLVSSNQLSNLKSKIFAYWLKDISILNGESVADYAESGGRIKTHNDEKYVRFNWEIDNSKIGESWKLFDKGGESRRWYGNKYFVVNWGEEARTYYAENGGLTRKKFWDKEGVCWTDVNKGTPNFRVKDADSQYSSLSPTLFFKKNDKYILGLLNSVVGQYFSQILNPSFHLNVGDVLELPVKNNKNVEIERYVEQAIEISKKDWNKSEVSFSFSGFPFFDYSSKNVANVFESIINDDLSTIETLKEIEESLNEYFIDLYGLESEVTKQVDLKNITLFSNYHSISHIHGVCEYKSYLTTKLFSAFVGHCMGRYSLGKKGIVYGQANNEAFKALEAVGAYDPFPADEDGILPLASEEWLFDDDATTRFKEFIRTVWGDKNLSENLEFVAESLCLHALKSQKYENATDTIRRYFSTQFYKDHCKTFKKRPIYWLFSSGKERAFECLVYLHRYNEGTLSRMRTEYVTPLMGKYDAQHTLLSEQQLQATGTEARRIEKELKSLEKKQAELRTFDEQLKHYAEMRITLDLDDGVKANYGKFGNLLADVKAIHGKAVK